MSLSPQRLRGRRRASRLARQRDEDAVRRRPSGGRGIREADLARDVRPARARARRTDLANMYSAERLVTICVGRRRRQARAEAETSAGPGRGVFLDPGPALPIDVLRTTAAGTAAGAGRRPALRAR